MPEVTAQHHVAHLPVSPRTTQDASRDPCSNVRIQDLNHLLVHLPDYGVLLCKSCKFAVQPRAISSHLLRHRVYRDKRQTVLELVAQLYLLEPDKVPIPTVGIRPFLHLPVHAGYRCSFPKCGHLYISYKRMSLHLQERHKKVPSGLPHGGMDQVYLQTFFKGNQVRYFEVEQEVATTASGAAQQPLAYRHQFLVQSSSTADKVASDGDSIKVNVEDFGKSKFMPHQITDLMYFHQYITCTGLSLQRGTEPASVWIYDIPQTAATHHFLMHGILGVAAFQQALDAADLKHRAEHRTAALKHQSAGLAIFRSLIDCPTAVTSTALAAFARLLGVQYCAEAVLEAIPRIPGTSNHADCEISRVTDFMNLLNGGTDILLSMQHLLPVDSGLRIPPEALQGLGQLEVPSEALQGHTLSLVNEVCIWLSRSQHGGDLNQLPFRASSLDDVRLLVELCMQVLAVENTQAVTAELVRAIIPSSSDLVSSNTMLVTAIIISRTRAGASYHNIQQAGHGLPSPVLLCYPHIPPKTYEWLVSLPTRLLARIPQLTNLEIRAFDLAMAALVSSYSRSFAADTAWARWNGIESWPRMLSAPFLDMLKSAHPLALVLVAQWCALLFMQGEQYWFLRGQAQRMLDVILANLDVELHDLAREAFSLLK